MIRLPAALTSMPRSLLVTLLASIRLLPEVTCMPAPSPPLPLFAAVLALMMQSLAALIPSPLFSETEHPCTVDLAPTIIPAPVVADGVRLEFTLFLAVHETTRQPTPV